MTIFFFFFFSDEIRLHRCSKIFSTSLRYVINIACTAKWSLNEKNTRNFQWRNPSQPVGFTDRYLVCFFFVPIERCPVPRSHGMFTLFPLKFRIKDETNNASNASCPTCLRSIQCHCKWIYGKSIWSKDIEESMRIPIIVTQLQGFWNRL